ncbi:putative thiosulfate sulfurtransferase [Aspergillus campestris IBT 28561]|uniref:Thiosulfate sulfurtransferase n=1 Tax=Aspergillus campestris (strain IBT 28561) TaxID=1392248 RepID=A0A2I1CR93_ASPC2|nr:putative thiosulfate sulfurtransferase [Aspergillus campestris IBT 28561]PKY00129.1 putative thiosulfate sulfurtransferase [Aspergillus campestris IBT 28561]
MESSNPFTSILVSPSELNAAIKSTPRRIVPVAAGAGTRRGEFTAQHIPGSIFFNMDEIRDKSHPITQMLPSAADFAAAMSAMGVQRDDVLVVYDTVDVGMYSAPRVAWTCRFFGHRDVHVLNNFRAYAKEGYPVATGEVVSFPDRPAADAAPQPYAVCEPVATDVIGYDELREAVRSPSEPYQIIDARIPGRFAGTQEEMSLELRSGHIPGAVNVPLAAMLDEEKGFLSVEELRRVFDNAGVRGDRAAVLTCNSGVTAAALDLAMGLIGYGPQRRLYDGSWMEWTRRAEEELVVVS